MTIPSSRSLIFQGKSTGRELAFICVLRLRKTSEVFRLLRKTLDFFGNLRKWSCRVQNYRHCQEKNLTLIYQKKLAGIVYQTHGIHIQTYERRILINITQKAHYMFITISCATHKCQSPMKWIWLHQDTPCSWRTVVCQPHCSPSHTVHSAMVTTEGVLQTM